MRTNLTVGDLGDLLDRPLIAVLATLRTDGTVLLSPVYHEWRDGGFNIWVEQQNVKARHLRRDPRATILVAESDPPLRAVWDTPSSRKRACPRTSTARSGGSDSATKMVALGSRRRCRALTFCCSTQTLKPPSRHSW